MVNNLITKINNHKEIFLLLLAAFILKFLTIISFKDIGWEPDSYMHFLQLRSIYTDFPNNLLIGIDVWAKPLYTFLLGIPVHLFSLEKLIWVQFLNLIIFSLITLLVYKIVLDLYKNKFASLTAAMLIIFSLNLLKSSTSTLTEPLFTLCLVLGFYYTVKRHYVLAGFLYGLSVLGRIEGLFFVVIYNLWILAKLEIFKNLSSKLKTSKRNIIKNSVLILRIYLSSFLPVLLWNYIGQINTGRILYIFDRGYPLTAGVYGYGSLFDYPKRLIIQESLILVCLLVAFILYAINSRKLKFRAELFLSFIFFVGFLFTQIWFWKTGRFGSAGLMRYLVSVLPFAVIFGSLFVKRIFEVINSENKKLFVFLVFGIVQLVIIAINIFGIGPISSKWIYFDSNLRDAGHWISANVSKNEKIFSVRPEVIYYANLNGNLTNSTINYKNRILLQEKGVYVWDKEWESTFNISFEQMNENAKLIKQFGENLYIFVIE